MSANSMLARRIRFSLSHSLASPFCIPATSRKFHLNSLSNPPKYHCSNRSKSISFQKHTRVFHQNRFVSTNYQMGDARRPPVVPIPDPERADRAELFRAVEASLGSSFSCDPLVPPPHPLIVVVSGPSGVGKDAVIKKLREMRENIHFVVTATTRAKRPGEVEGKDYYFMSKDEFLQMISKDELLEHALVYGDYKGIPKQQIREYMANGFDIVLRVDIQGAATLRRILGKAAVFVFVTAESEYEMVNRLIQRKTETKEALLVRISTAREEMKHVKHFDYVVVNGEGKLESTAKLVESIIDAEKAKVARTIATI